jgi:hypothetical protein
MRTLLVALCLVLSAGAARADWTPSAFAAEETLEFLTIEDGEEHWSPVWLVVIDDQVYLRLGGRAAGRYDRNASKPYLKVRIAGQQFDKVLGDPAPAMAEAVAEAMADKYWSDVFIRFFSHPLTLRLTPAGD